MVAAIPSLSHIQYTQYITHGRHHIYHHQRCTFKDSPNLPIYVGRDHVPTKPHTSQTDCQLHVVISHWLLPSSLLGTHSIYLPQPTISSMPEGKLKERPRVRLRTSWWRGKSNIIPMIMSCMWGPRTNSIPSTSDDFLLFFFYCNFALAFGNVTVQ